MSGRVLVAYASKYGATAEIAEKIGEILRQAGLSVDVLQVDHVDSLAPYGAVVLGSAVYIGQWRKEASAFLKDKQAALSKIPVWLFSSGPTGQGDAVQMMKGWRFPEALQPVANGIGPRDIAFFHGEIDMKKPNFGEKLIIKGVKAPTGDFRDWNLIQAWATTIADMLKTELSQPLTSA